MRSKDLASTRRQALLLAALGAAAGAGPPARAQTGQGPAAAPEPLDPRAFGAIADGASHPLSAADIAAHPDWIGRYQPGVEWDAAALQECLYAAFAAASAPGRPVWNIASRAYHLNRPVRLSAGRYRINRTLLSPMTGFSIWGDGRLASVLVWTGAEDQPMWLCDSATYGRFADFGLEAASATRQALLELDGSGANGGLKTQQVSLRDLAFVCNGQAAIGLRISRSGGSAQGDTVLIDNCFFGGAALAGLAVGETSSQNALGITIHGGDFQACLPHGVLVFGGQVFVQNTSFQNQAYGSPRNQIAMGGADLTIHGGSGVGGFSVMRDIRSESDVLAQSDGGLYLENASLASAGIGAWSPSLRVQAGAVYRGTPGPGKPGQRGRSFICVRSGATGAVEPDWNSAPRGASLTSGPRGGTIEAGSTRLTLGRGGPKVGDQAVVPGAGTGGQALIATVSAAGQGAAILSTPALQGRGEGMVYYGRAISDGSAAWMEVDFDCIRGAHCTNVSSGAGRTRSCAVYRNCLFSRPDWLRTEAEDPWPAEVEWWRTPLVIDNVQIAAGGYNQPQLAHNPFTDDPAAAVSSFSLATGRPALVRTMPVPDAAEVDLSPLLLTGNLLPIAPTRDLRLSAPAALAGRELVLVATSRGGAGRRISFGAGFRTQGPLVLHPAPGRIATIRFVSDGQAFLELSRSALS